MKYGDIKAENYFKHRKSHLLELSHPTQGGFPPPHQPGTADGVQRVSRGHGSTRWHSGQHGPPMSHPQDITLLQSAVNSMQYYQTYWSLQLKLLDHLVEKVGKAQVCLCKDPRQPIKNQESC